MSGHEKLLMIKPSSLGDIIHGLQVADAIKAQKPDCHITWVASLPFAPLVQACNVVDEVIVFDRAAGWNGLRRVLRDIRESGHFYHVLDMQGLARSGLMTLAARCARAHKLGRRDAREGASLACGRRTALPPGGRESHALDILLEFLPLLGLKKSLGKGLVFQSRPPETLPPEALEAPVVLFPSSRRAEKQWPGFRALAAALCQSGLQRPVVWADSKPAVEALAPMEGFYDCSGRTTLASMVGLIQCASLVIANDSGPMHVAAALGKPVLALFGPTDPVRFGPYPLDCPRHRILRPASGRLADLTVDEVTKAAQALV